MKTKRSIQQKELDNENVKLAFHIHKQSSSIDVKKQLGDFEKHEKLLQLHGKYKNNKVWGGGVPGSVSYKGSPKRFKMKETLVKLPPLSHTSRSGFGGSQSGVMAGKLSISDAGMPKIGQAAMMSSSTKSGRSAFSIVNDLKPNTASGHHSMKRLESVEEIVSKKSGRNGGAFGRNHALVAAMKSQNS